MKKPLKECKSLEDVFDDIFGQPETENKKPVFVAKTKEQEKENYTLWQNRTKDLKILFGLLTGILKPYEDARQLPETSIESCKKTISDFKSDFFTLSFEPDFEDYGFALTFDNSKYGIAYASFFRVSKNLISAFESSCKPLPVIDGSVNFRKNTPKIDLSIFDRFLDVPRIEAVNIKTNILAEIERRFLIYNCNETNILDAESANKFWYEKIDSRVRAKKPTEKNISKLKEVNKSFISDLEKLKNTVENTDTESFKRDRLIKLSFKYSGLSDFFYKVISSGGCYNNYKTETAFSQLSEYSTRIVEVIDVLDRLALLELTDKIINKVLFLKVVILCAKYGCKREQLQGSLKAELKELNDTFDSTFKYKNSENKYRTPKNTSEEILHRDLRRKLMAAYNKIEFLENHITDDTLAEMQGYFDKIID